MKPSTELLRPRSTSLTKSEKRFFKLHSTLQSGDKNYLRIFDAIDKQKVYDEDGLKRLFAKETVHQALPFGEEPPVQVDPESPARLSCGGHVSGILKQEIKNIEILYDKALYKECNKLLHRAKRIALENEKFYYLFELLNWEKMLLEEAYESGEFTKDLDALIAEESEVLEKLRNLAAYHILYSKINYVFRSGGYVRSEEEHAMVEEIAQHPLIVGKNTALSHRAATICFYTQGFCAWAKRDWRMALTKFLRVKEILDRETVLKPDLAKRYVRTLHYIINAQIELGEYKAAREHIKLMRSLSELTGFGGIQIGMQVFNASYLSELRLMDRMGEHTKALDLVDAVLVGLRTEGPACTRSTSSSSISRYPVCISGPVR
jgi:tetratricopeptide (TPR) repeat protein